MKLSEVCFREAVRLPGTQRRELLVRARDVCSLVEHPDGVYMEGGGDNVVVPWANVLWRTIDKSAQLQASQPGALPPPLRKRRG